MKKTSEVKFILVFGLLALAALTFASFPIQAIAQDADGDGIPDSLEKPGGAGITLIGNQKFVPCTGTQGENRHKCVDWQTPDLFVILVRANGCPGTPPTCSGSNVPLGSCAPLFNSGKRNIPLASDTWTSYAIAAYNPWALVEASKQDGGLGITIHEITASQVNSSTRAIPGTSQKAVRLTESLNACGTDQLGSSTWGTPNTAGTATLYTQRIINKIDQECAAAPSTCYDDLDSSKEIRPALYHLYLQSLLVHELGHVMALTKLWTPDYGGPHEVSGSGKIMEQKPIVKAISGSSVKWYISTDYSGQCQSDFDLFK
jgi:hypothetical protein